jgi:hypothetical protein
VCVCVCVCVCVFVCVVQVTPRTGYERRQRGDEGASGTRIRRKGHSPQFEGGGAFPGKRRRLPGVIIGAAHFFLVVLSRRLFLLFFCFSFCFSESIQRWGRDRVFRVTRAEFTAFSLFIATLHVSSLYVGVEYGCAQAGNAVR